MRRVVHRRHRDRDYALRRALFAADMVGLCVVLAVALAIGGNRGTVVSDTLWLLPILPLWALLFRGYGLYRRSIRRFEPSHLEDVPSLFHALVIGTLGMWVYYRFLAPTPQLNLQEVMVFGAVALPLIAGLRVVVRAINLREQGAERVFVIAPCDEVRMLQRKLARHPEYELEIVGSTSSEACEALGLELCADLDQVEALAASGQIDHVVARLDAEFLPQEQLWDLMRACHRDRIRFSFTPASKELVLPGVELNYVESLGVITAPSPVLGRTAAGLKRAMDVGVAGVATVVLAPLAALVAAAIKLDSRGPVLERSVRVGKHERRFKRNVFRTTEVGEERVTRMGRLLRRSGLDDIPELWNVLAGSMSLVGPRPLSEHEDEGVRGWQRHRLDLAPGITGYWQVLGRERIPFDEMLEVDYAYVASWSPWHDVKILAQTVPAALRRRRAG